MSTQQFRAGRWMQYGGRLLAPGTLFHAPAGSTFANAKPTAQQPPAPGTEAPKAEGKGKGKGKAEAKPGEPTTLSEMLRAEQPTRGLAAQAAAAQGQVRLTPPPPAAVESEDEEAGGVDLS